jgi:hypothetical protein
MTFSHASKKQTNVIKLRRGRHFLTTGKLLFFVQFFNKRVKKEGLRTGFQLLSVLGIVYSSILASR